MARGKKGSTKSSKSKKSTKKPLVKLKPGARKACGERVHPCGIDTVGIDEALCRLEQLRPSLDTSTIGVFEFTKCLAKRCKAAKIPVRCWLQEEIADGFLLGFDHFLHHGNIPAIQDVDGGCVPRRHDSSLTYYHRSSLPLHHADPQLQLAALPHLNRLFTEILTKAEELAAGLDEARVFDCMGQCCPFMTGRRCC
jgi:hypothetical protein